MKNKSTSITSASCLVFLAMVVACASPSDPKPPVTPPGKVPSSPTGLSLQSGNGQVSITFSPVDGASGYCVYWSTASTVSKSSANKAYFALSSGLRGGFTNGTKYYFIVTAVNAVGESEPSEVASATPVFPAPINMRTSVAPSEGRVYWDPVKGAASYKVYWAEGTNVAQSATHVVTGLTSNLCRVQGLNSGVTYAALVVAVDAAGTDSPPSSVVTFTPQAGENGDFYVSPSGNDSGTGTLADPWKSLSKASKTVAANCGNTIHLMAGNHVEFGAVFVPEGVNLVGEGKGVSMLTLDPTSAPNDTDFLRFESAAHGVGGQTISDFTLDGNNKAIRKGIVIRGRDDVVITRLEVKNCDENAITIRADDTGENAPGYFLSGFILSDSDFDNNSKDFEGKGWSSGVVTIAGLSGAEIHHNTITEMGGYGIKFGSSYGGFHGVKIHHNTISVNPVDSQWGADCAIELWNVFDHSEVTDNTVNTWISLVNENTDSAGVTSVTVRGNTLKSVLAGNKMEAIELCVSDAIVFDNQIENYGIGIATWLGTYHDNLIYRNTFNNGDQKRGVGIELYPKDGSMDGHRIWNNVFVGFDKGVSFNVKDGQRMSNLEIRNNLFVNCNNPFRSEQGLTQFKQLSNVKVTNNLSSGPGVTWVGVPETSVVSVVNLTAANNQWSVDPMLDADFHPLAGSPAIDAGVDVGLPFVGLAPEIGRYEY